MKKIFNKYYRYARIIKTRIIHILRRNRRGFTLPKPEEKWQVIDSLRKKSGARVFVETGTYMGDTVERFKDKFDKIYSIELGKELVSSAKERFRGQNHIEIIEGDSAKILPQILRKINEPTVFWLDAHYSDSTTVIGEDYSPILKELELILTSPIASKSLIAIDDARLFDGVDYPSLRKVRRITGKIMPDRKMSVENDIIKISGLSGQ